MSNADVAEVDFDPFNEPEDGDPSIKQLEAGGEGELEGEDVEGEFLQQDDAEGQEGPKIFKTLTDENIILDPEQRPDSLVTLFK
jgi:hypothetical protein